MSDKDDKLHELDTAYNQFRELIEHLPNDAYEEQWLGDWSLRHVLAHMSGWWREMVPAFERVANGERPVPEGVSYDNADAWNEQFAAEPMPASEALTDWDNAFHSYRAAASQLSEEVYGVDPAKGRPRIGDRLLGASGIDHLHEHYDQVKRWVESRAG